MDRHLPEAFLERDQWLLWSSDSKAPLNADGAIASWNDPASWLSHAKATELVAANDEFDGIGFVISENDPFIGLDLDSCLREPRTEKPKDWVPDLDTLTDTYMAYSGSGTGLHIFTRDTTIPEWWSDSQFPDRDHEGVEAYSEKFFAVTGDHVDIANPTITDVDIVPFLFETYQAIHGENPRLERSIDSNPDHSYDGGEYLDESDIRDALDHLDPSLSHDDWIEIGFAVHDWDNGAKGRQLFEEWSRGSSQKYDTQAQREIEALWETASQGTGVTLGTLVHHAKEAGWQPPTPDGGTQAKTPTETTPDIDHQYELKTNQLISLLGDASEHDVTDFSTHQLANGIEQILRSRDDIHLRLLDTVDSKDQPIYCMDPDTYVWENKGERRIAKISRQLLGTQNRRQVQKELINALQSSPDDTWFIDRDQMGIETGELPLADNVLDLQTRTTRDADPHDYLLGRLPAEYDPDADIEDTRFEEFILQSVKKDDREKLQEYAGYTLLKNAQPYKKALFLVGPTDSGKGTFLKTLEQILGVDNVANEPLRELVDSRWGAHSLYGRMVNISNEVSPKGFQDIGKFKMYTGGEDRVSAEDKGVSKYEFTVTQKFLFATNEFPDVEDADEAFYNRLLFVEFPNTVPEEDQEDLQEIFKEERSAILNWMLDGLTRLQDNGGVFTNQRSIDEKKSLTQAFGSPVEQFAHDALRVTDNPEHVVHKKELYDAFTRFCDWARKDTPTQQKFTKTLNKQTGISDGKSSRVDPDGNLKDVFKGVKLEEDFLTKVQADIPTHSYKDGSGGQTRITK